MDNEKELLRMHDLNSKHWRLYEKVIEFKGLRLTPVEMSRLARAVVVYAKEVYGDDTA